MCRYANRIGTRRGFTLVEVIIALVILGIGLVGIIQLFPMGLKSSARAENSTRASLLAQEIMESLKADSHDLPIIPGDPNLYPIPGDGFDNDQRADVKDAGAVDFNGNGRLDMDWDGGYVDRYTGNQLEPDGIPDPPVNPKWPFLFDPGYSLGPYQGDWNGDGDPFYDPETNNYIGIDEEYADGIDNDGDGKIDEDCRLASNYIGGTQFLYDPLAPGDGIDNDGDGEDKSPERRILVDDDGNPATRPVWKTVKIADGEDNDGNGVIDEGIDEDIYTIGGRQTDCRMAAYPFVPRPFPPKVYATAGIDQARYQDPNESFSWQIFVGRVSDGGGDGLDNDGDGEFDEDPRDGIDNDLDGLIDEDPSPMPLPGFRKIVVRITWGGDRVNNDGDFDIDLETGARIDRIDEEMKNGIDDDGDGRIDEDVYEYFYDLTGYIQLKSAQ